MMKFNKKLLAMLLSATVMLHMVTPVFAIESTPKLAPQGGSLMDLNTNLISVFLFTQNLKRSQFIFVSSSGEYSSILELMHYFYLEFNVYIILLIIMIVNCLKTIKNYQNIIHKKSNMPANPLYLLIISILCEPALFNAYLLQAIISDISIEASELWINKVSTLCLISFLIFIVHIYFTNRLIKYLK